MTENCILIFHPLPDMPILNSSSSTTNKDIVSKMWTNSYTDIRVENIGGKGEIARLFLMCQNEYLCS